MKKVKKVKIVKYRMCYICRKKVENGPGMHIVLSSAGLAKFSHLDCALKNNLYWGPL